MSLTHFRADNWLFVISVALQIISALSIVYIANDAMRKFSPHGNRRLVNSIDQGYKSPRSLLSEIHPRSTWWYVYTSFVSSMSIIWITLKRALIFKPSDWSYSLRRHTDKFIIYLVTRSRGWDNKQQTDQRERRKLQVRLWKMGYIGKIVFLVLLSSVGIIQGKGKGDVLSCMYS